MKNLDLIKKAVENPMSETDKLELEEHFRQWWMSLEADLAEDIDAINDFLETCSE